MQHMDLFPIKKLFVKLHSFKMQEETTQWFINLIWTSFDFAAWPALT